MFEPSLKYKGPQTGQKSARQKWEHSSIVSLQKYFRSQVIELTDGQIVMIQT